MATLEDDFKNFVSDELSDWGESIVYTPQSGSPKTISAIILKESFVTHFAETDYQPYDSVEIMISSRNDTEGVITPKLMARDGAGDQFIMSVINSGVPLYVHDLSSPIEGGFHTLKVSTSQILIGL